MAARVAVRVGAASSGSGPVGTAAAGVLCAAAGLPSSRRAAASITHDTADSTGNGHDAVGTGHDYAVEFSNYAQALKISIPGIVSSFIGLFKDTTLVALVGLHDPLQGVTKVVRAAIEWKGIYWEPYIFVGLIFFACCFSMSRYSMYLERKLKRDHR